MATTHSARPLPAAAPALERRRRPTVRGSRFVGDVLAARTDAYAQLAGHADRGEDDAHERAVERDARLAAAARAWHADPSPLATARLCDACDAEGA